MKLVEDLREGNAVVVGKDLFIVLKSIYNKGSRGASTVRLKMKNLATGSVSETVYRAGEKFNDVVLERRQMQFLYGADERYTFMDQETYDQVELNKDDLGEALQYIKEQMVIEIKFHEGRAVGIEVPLHVALKVTYTEPAVKGDTGGKVMKSAKTETGLEVQVPIYINIGDMIRVDTRTGEFEERA